MYSFNKSTISNSFLFEGLSFSAYFTTLLSKKYNPVIAKFVLGFFGFSSKLNILFPLTLAIPNFSGLETLCSITFAPFLDSLAKAASYLAENKVAAAGLVGVLTTLAGLSVANAIANIFASALLTGPIAGPILAATITAGMIAAIGSGIAMATADDMVMPSGYGDRILSTPKGSVALNNQDTIVAGTNLGGGENKEAKETNMLLRQILTKQGTVTINTTQAGTAFAMNTYEVQ